MRLFGASLPSVPATPWRRRPRRVALTAIAALLVASAMIGASSSSPRRAAAVGPAILTLPASASGGVGTDINVDIAVADIAAPGLGGYVVAMQWDPAIVSLTSLSDSGWVTGGGLIVICTAPTIDNVAGNAELDCTPAPLPFGDGVTTVAPHPIANAVFHANALGTTTIDLTGSSLLNPFALDVPATITNGSLNVVLSVGGVASPPDPAALTARDGGRGDDALRYGPGIAVALAAAAAIAWRRGRAPRRARTHIGTFRR